MKTKIIATIIVMTSSFASAEESFQISGYGSASEYRYLGVAKAKAIKIAQSDAYSKANSKCKQLHQNDIEARLQGSFTDQTTFTHDSDHIYNVDAISTGQFLCLRLE